MMTSMLNMRNSVFMLAMVLMSITNAVSGIIILGGMLHLSTDATTAAIVFGAFAVFFATINIAGGFTVTRRMLAMFRK